MKVSLDIYFGIVVLTLRLLGNPRTKKFTFHSNFHCHQWPLNLLSDNFYRTMLRSTFYFDVSVDNVLLCSS